VEVDSGTVDDAGKMRRATVRGEAPARTSHRTAYVACLAVVTLRNSRDSLVRSCPYFVASRLEIVGRWLRVDRKRKGEWRVLFGQSHGGTRPYFRLP
ncbi:hypothetical protein ALC57_13182, partial [Trachymyrmex cornetzi]